MNRIFGIKTFYYTFSLAFVLGLLVHVEIWAANPAVNWIHQMETTVNPLVSGDHKYPEIIMLPNIDIPLRILSADIATNWDKKIQTSLIFEKNGEKYVRWILAPGEKEIGLWGKSTSRFNQEIIDFANRHGVDTTIHHYYKGYPTSSSTYLVEDLNLKTTFYVKTSNSNAPMGVWSNKPRREWEAKDARLINDYLTEMESLVGFKYFTFLPEPAAFVANEIDQSLIVRDSGDMKNEKANFYYFPGFSFTDEKIGLEIALKNGSNDPAAFWSQHAPKILARASMELFLKTGLILDSPHGQNYFFELDKNFKLTGRLVFRDLADVHIRKEFYDLFQNRFNLKRFTQKKNIADGKLSQIAMVPLSSAGPGISVSLLAHPWFGDKSIVLTHWQESYIDECDRIITELTGLDPKIFATVTEKKHPGSRRQRQLKNGMMISLEVAPENLAWLGYVNQLSKNIENRTAAKRLQCSHLF